MCSLKLNAQTWKVHFFHFFHFKVFFHPFCVFFGYVLILIFYLQKNKIIINPIFWVFSTL
jgi:hypothetical protein